MGTVPGREGETYLNGRISLEMCLQDTSSDEAGCQTDSIKSWCEDHGFADVPGKVVCLPSGSKFENGEVFSEAVAGYDECKTRATAPCLEFRKYLFSGFPCPGCAPVAERAALSEATCSAQTSEAACAEVSEELFPNLNGTGAAAPAAAPRPSEQVASCAWVTQMGCISTINNGPDGIKLLENRVELEACIGYNKESMGGCPGHAANFCATKEFSDIDLSVCMPSIGSYDSGRDFVHHFVIYKECNGLVGDDCSAARDYLYSGMGCRECGAWADVSALNEANCTRKVTEEDCVGVDRSGHVYQETLGGPAPGAVIPAADAIGSDEADTQADDIAPDGDEDGGGDGEGDDGDGDGGVAGRSPVVDTPATCMWIEECCCYPTVQGQIGVDYVGARVMLEFCLFDTRADLTGCRSLQYSNICNEFKFNDINAENGGATLCLPDLSTFTSGADLIDALSIYYTCHGLSDLDCNLARGFLFEGVQCPSCGEAARIAAPLEGACKVASTVTACIDAGTTAAETDTEVIDEVNAGAALGKFAPIASANKDSVPPPALRDLLRPREVVQPSFTVTNPPAETATAVPVASAAAGGMRRGAVATAVLAAALVALAAAL